MDNLQFIFSLGRNLQIIHKQYHQLNLIGWYKDFFTWLCGLERKVEAYLNIKISWQTDIILIWKSELFVISSSSEKTTPSKREPYKDNKGRRGEQQQFGSKGRYQSPGGSSKQNTPEPQQFWLKGKYQSPGGSSKHSGQSPGNSKQSGSSRQQKRNEKPRYALLS